MKQSETVIAIHRDVFLIFSPGQPRWSAKPDIGRPTAAEKSESMQGVERAGWTVLLNTLPAAFGLQTESLPRKQTRRISRPE
jgi:hypothetical protein